MLVGNDDELQDTGGGWAPRQTRFASDVFAGSAARLPQAGDCGRLPTILWLSGIAKLKEPAGRQGWQTGSVRLHQR